MKLARYSLTLPAVGYVAVGLFGCVAVFALGPHPSEKDPGIFLATIIAYSLAIGMSWASLGSLGRLDGGRMSPVIRLILCLILALAILSGSLCLVEELVWNR